MTAGPLQDTALVGETAAAAGVVVWAPRLSYPAGGRTGGGRPPPRRTAAGRTGRGRSEAEAVPPLVEELSPGRSL